LLLGGYAYWWWTGLPEEYGAYVPVRCLEETPEGQSCIQRTITEEERIALVKGRKEHADGVFEISVSGDRLDVIDPAIKVGNSYKRRSQTDQFSSVRQEALRCANGAFDLLAIIPEFPGRWSAVYRTKEGRRMLFVRYDFRTVGGKMGSFEYMLRSRINGNPATLVLMNSVRGHERMWATSWTAGGVDFELEIEDVKTHGVAGKPYTPAEVLEMASVLDANCHWSRSTVQ